MRLQKAQSASYCVGIRHMSVTINICGNITSTGIEVLIGFCSICSRRKSMTVSDNTILAERSNDIFKNLGKKRT